MMTIRSTGVLVWLFLLTGCLDGKVRPAAGDGPPGGDLAPPPGDGAVPADKQTAEAPPPDTLLLPDSVDPNAPTGMFCPENFGGGGGLPCTGAADCTSYTYTFCVDGFCRQCAADSDCTPAPKNTGKCDISHWCRRCDTAADCLAADLGAVCNSYGHCRQCSEDSHCLRGPGNTGKCLTGQDSCTRCENDTDCTETGLGARCDLERSWCVGCFTNSDCLAGLAGTAYCHDQTCSGCKTGQDCVDAGMPDRCVCYSDNPNTTPNEDTCPPGQVCRDEACLPE